MRHPSLLPVCRILSLALLLGFASIGQASEPGQFTSCLERSRTNVELDQCGGSLLKLFEERIEGEYRRLGGKFTGNEKMQEMLKNSRSNWEHYRNNQCVMEASAATGSYVVQPFSLEANRVYFKCMARTFGEMKSSLEKY